LGSIPRQYIRGRKELPDFRSITRAWLTNR
jgi:hypothetical protein